MLSFGARSVKVRGVTHLCQLNRKQKLRATPEGAGDPREALLTNNFSFGKDRSAQK